MAFFQKRFIQIKKISIATILLGALITGSSGCALIPKEEEVLAPPIKEPEKVVFNTVEAKLSSIEDYIECTGTYVSAYQQDVFYSERGGRIKEIYIKEGNQVLAGDVLVEIDTSNLEKDIVFQEINLKKAQISFDKMKSQIGPINDYDLELARLNLEETTLRLQNMRDEYEAAHLRAPIDGQITYFAGMKIGDTVNTYQIIATIADPDNLQIRYSGDRVPEFKLGIGVEITQRTDKYMGEVVATPEEMPADANPNKKQAILINATDMPDDTKMGTSVTIKLIREKREDVIVISKALLNNFAGRTFVNVLVDGVREERDVETGINTVMEVEIKKGLSVGELLITK